MALSLLQNSNITLTIWRIKVFGIKPDFRSGGVLMSIQSSAAGFGYWCCMHNIQFNIPSLGSVYIGSSIASVLNSFSETMKKPLDLEVKDRDFVFKDGNEVCLVLSTSGIYVTGIKRKGLVSGVDITLCHNEGNYSYLLPVRIDDGMIWIKGINEVKLKAVKQVSCDSYTTSELSICPTALNKTQVSFIRDSISRFRQASARLRDRGIQKQEPLSKMANSAKTNDSRQNRVMPEPDETLLQLIRDKSWEYRNIMEKVNKYDRPLRETQNRIAEFEKEYQHWLYRQNSSYGQYFSRYRLEDVVREGKLKIGEYGEYVLDEDSKIPSYTTDHPDTEFVTTGSCYAPCHGAQLYSCYEYQGSFPSEYTWIVPTTKTILHEDEAYKKALEFVNSLDYQKYYPEVKSSYRRLAEARYEYQEMLNERNVWSQSQECAALLYQAGEIANEVSVLRVKANLR